MATLDSRGHEVQAYFLLAGDFDPDDITERVGIQPTRAWQTGDIVDARSGRPHEQSGWEIQPSLASPADLEDWLEALFAALRPGWSRLIEVCRQYRAGIICVVYANDAQAGQHFDRSVVQRAADLNAWIDLDLYCLGEEQENQTSW